MRSLYRSLALIVGINVGAYFVIHLAYSIFTNYFLPVIAPKDEWFIFAYTSFGLSLVPIFNAPILYINRCLLSSASVDGGSLEKIFL